MLLREGQLGFSTLGCDIDACETSTTQDGTYVAAFWEDGSSNMKIGQGNET